MNSRRIAFATSLILVTGLSACSSAGDTGNKPEAPRPISSSATPSPSQSATPQVMTAEELGSAIHGILPQMTVFKVYTAANDPNNLLGRPGGYESKIAFWDSRVSADDKAYTDKDAIERGGTIEVFASPVDTQDRSDYIQKTLKAAKILGIEYHYVSGDYLVRVTGNLTPAQAKSYEAALAQVIH